MKMTNRRLRLASRGRMPAGESKHAKDDKARERFLKDLLGFFSAEESWFDRWFMDEYDDLKDKGDMESMYLDVKRCLERPHFLYDVELAVEQMERIMDFMERLSNVMKNRLRDYEKVRKDMAGFETDKDGFI